MPKMARNALFVFVKLETPALFALRRKRSIALHFLDSVKEKILEEP
jgi:hypothetical protein